MREHEVLVRQRYPEHRPGQHVHNRPFDLDRFLGIHLVCSVISEIPKSVSARSGDHRRRQRALHVDALRLLSTRGR